MDFLRSWRKKEPASVPNPDGRLLAVGDIHGCSMALVSLMDAVAPGPDDLVVYLGDYVDRGPDTRGVIDHIRAQAEAQPVVSLRGNHELLMLGARESRFQFHSWQSVGGWETLESYDCDGSPAWIADVPDEHWQFLMATEPWLETESHIFVHARPNPEKPMHAQSERELYWERCADLPLHQSGKPAVIGHTRQASGVPAQFAGGVCIDTAAVSGQWLTCLCAGSGEYWQANMEGRIRTGALENWPPSGAAEIVLDNDRVSGSGSDGAPVGE